MNKEIDKAPQTTLPNGLCRPISIKGALAANIPAPYCLSVYARVDGVRHVSMTDGMLRSKGALSGLQRMVQRINWAKKNAVLVASGGSFRLYRSYALSSTAMFKSHLCANNAAYGNAPQTKKLFDFIFCGRFTSFKNSLLAIEDVRGVTRQLGRRASIMFVGPDQVETEMRAVVSAAVAKISGTFSGLAKQDALSSLNGSARVLRLTVQQEGWGRK
jgi:hypothetical protein